MTSHVALPYYSLKRMELKGCAGGGSAGADWTLRSGLTFFFFKEAFCHYSVSKVHLTLTWTVLPPRFHHSSVCFFVFHLIGSKQWN